MRGYVYAPSLEIFKARLDGGFDGPGLQEDVLSMAGGLELDL